MNLLDMYRANAADRGSDPAITFASPPYDGLTMTWSGVIERSAALAEELSAEGVGSGSRVATVLVDHPDALPALLAMWQLGAVPVLVDPEWGATIRDGVLSHSRADALVAIGDRLAVRPLGSAPPADRPGLPPGTAMLAYTSGSTAAPKGIPLHHDRLVAALYASAGEVTGFRGEPPTRVGSSMRLSGFGVLALHYLWSAAFGAELVVLPRLELAAAKGYWAELDRHEIDQAVLVPALYELLLRASKPAEQQPRTLFVNSSGPISATTHSRFMERFDVLVLNCYGLTETTFACMVGDTDERGSTTQAVGRPDVARVRLCDENGERVSGPGEGEIEVRGPTISDGYYDNPEANSALFSGPWLKTGDLARRDETGKYWIVGRLKDAVMKGGTTVYLTEVEEACVALDGVLEAVAVRVDLPGGIEDLGAIVRPIAGVDLDSGDLKASLDEALGATRGPRRVVVADRALPRIGQNKIDRRSAERLWSELTSRS
jgi:long-chain acyl-CoA synthetase